MCRRLGRMSICVLRSGKSIVVGAYKTIGCTYFRIVNGKLEQRPGRGLREIVYVDLDAAAKRLLSGFPVYVEVDEAGIQRFREMIAVRLGESVGYGAQ